MGRVTATKRPKNISQIIQEIDKYELQSADKDLFAKVKVAIEEFDYKGAEDILQRLH